MCSSLDASLAGDVLLFDTPLVAEGSLAAMLLHPINVKPIRLALTIIFMKHKNVFMTTPLKTSRPDQRDHS